MTHFQLVTTHGEALRATELARPEWPPGSVIYRGGDEPNLRVVGRIAGDDPETYEVLVVGRASNRARRAASVSVVGCVS